MLSGESLYTVKNDYEGSKKEPELIPLLFSPSCIFILGQYKKNHEYKKKNLHIRSLSPLQILNTYGHKEKTFP